jgi:hypothetical protein
MSLGSRDVKRRCRELARAIGTVGALAFTAYTVRRQVDRERRADDYQRRIYVNRVSIT